MSDPDVAEALGARMRELRVKAGLTQAAVSDRTGIHRPIIARLEGGAHVPRIDSILRYARAIGVQPSAILGVLDTEGGAR